MVVVNLIIKSFVRRIREKLLEIDLDRDLDVSQTAASLADGRRSDFSRDENSLVNRLQTQSSVQSRTLGDTDQTLAQPLLDRESKSLLAHLAGPVHHVAHADSERRVP